MTTRKTNSTKMRLNDDKNILKFYKMDTKKISSNEKRAISICYNSVIKKKKIKIFDFKCKKTAKLLNKKGTRKVFIERLKSK